MYDKETSAMISDIHETITNVRMDIAAMKTDIIWVKRIVGAVAVAAAAYYGFNLPGVV